MFDSILTHPDYFKISYFTVVVILLNTVTAIHILLNKHEQPVSAVMWLLLVFFIPLLGLSLYLFFGINRTKHRALTMQIANQFILEAREKKQAEINPELLKIPPEKKDEIHNTLSNYLHQQHFYEYNGGPKEPYPEYCKMLDRLLPDTIPLTGNHVELLLDGTQAYPKMLSQIEKAQHSIHLQSYIIMNDTIGKTLFGVLKKKASEGVKIKVLYDRFGSMHAFITMFFPKVVKNMKNFEVVPFTQFRPWSIQLRNHRKLMVIDGQTAFIGGINISNDNYGKTARKDRYIHDLHCLVSGPVVGELQFSFLRDWHCITNTPPMELLKDEYFPPMFNQGKSIARLIASGPGQCYEATDKVYMTAVSTAKKYVWLMSPYFVPDKPFVKLLCSAVGRGIEIKIVVPAKNNHWYIQLATHSLYLPLLEAGVRIFEKKGPFSHAKAMLIDGQWAKMGSSNCDVRSFKLNYELDFIVSQGEFLEELHNQFNEEIADSTEILLENIINKSIPVQLAENFCALFTPIL